MTAKSKEPPRFGVGEPAEIFAIESGEEKSLGRVTVVRVTLLTVVVEGPDNSGGVSCFGYTRDRNLWAREKYGRTELRKVAHK